MHKCHNFFAISQLYPYRMRIFFLLWFAGWLFASAGAAQSSAEAFSVLSWNIRHFGTSKDAAAIAFIGRAIQPYDIVTLQEVVAGPGGAQAVSRLAEWLNRYSGWQWDCALCPPTRGNPRQSERYAFLWRAANWKPCSRAELLSALDSLVEREPCMLCLQQGVRRLLLFSFHARTRSQYPEVEIQHLAQALIPQAGRPIVLAGDFNTPESHPVFFPLVQAGFRSALQQEATTLRRTAPERPGQSAYLHPFDNVFFSGHCFERVRAGKIDLARLAGSLEAALRISDHAPVWVRLRWIGT